MVKSVTSVAPDFDTLFLLLKDRLNETNTWQDLLPTSMGTTVIDMFAGAGITSQINIEIALRESFLLKARRDSSIYTNTRDLGVNVTRRIPAGTRVSLTNNTGGAVFIPPYSQFLIDGLMFFNRYQLVIGTAQTVYQVELYNGEVKTITVDLDGVPDLQLFNYVLQEPGFHVSAVDCMVYTRNKITTSTRIWQPTDHALWEHTPDDYVYFESSTEKGEPSFIFGDDTNGASLSYGHTLNIRYALTEGADGNNAASGQTVSYIASPAINGMTTDAVAGGANHKEASYYKKYANVLFRSRKRFISGEEYKAGIITYPGVADVTIQSQRDIAPNDHSWMNNMRVCILPEHSDTLGGANPNPKSAAWSSFVKWLDKRTHKFMVVQTWNPTKIPVHIELEVAIVSNESSEDIKTKIIENILILFEKRPGILGRKLALTDITDAAKKVEGVDYVELISPTKSVVPSDKLSYVVLQGLPTIRIIHTERTIEHA